MKYNYTVFSTNNNKYLFDGISCNIFNISDGIFNNHEYLICGIDNKLGTIDELNKDYNEINEAKELGYLKAANEDKFRYWFDEELYRKNFQKDMRHLMIGLTEQCNMVFCQENGQVKCRFFQSLSYPMYSAS